VNNDDGKPGEFLAELCNEQAAKPTWPNTLMIELADRQLGSKLTRLLPDHFAWTKNNYPIFTEAISQSFSSSEITKSFVCEGF